LGHLCYQQSVNKFNAWVIQKAPDPFVFFDAQAVKRLRCVDQVGNELEATKWTD
jgi:hypothetical protein